MSSVLPAAVRDGTRWQEHLPVSPLGQMRVSHSAKHQASLSNFVNQVTNTAKIPDSP